MTVRFYTSQERPELRSQRAGLAAIWPKFIREYDIKISHYWDTLVNQFPQYQVFVVDESDRLVADCYSTPVHWDGRSEGLSERGWTWAIEFGGNHGLGPNRLANALSILGASVLPSEQGKGLGAMILGKMKELALNVGELVAPVRPTRKHLYPLTEMARYVTWTHPHREAPFDPWLRTHLRLGGQAVGVAPQSMTIRGSIAEWEDWTQMRFPDSGDYVVPNALVPVRIDRERNEGVYVEPNIWVRYGARLQ